MENKQQSLPLTEAKERTRHLSGANLCQRRRAAGLFTERLREKLPELRQMEGFPRGRG